MEKSNIRAVSVLQRKIASVVGIKILQKLLIECITQVTYEIKSMLYYIYRNQIGQNFFGGIVSNMKLRSKRIFCALLVMLITTSVCSCNKDTDTAKESGEIAKQAETATVETTEAGPTFLPDGLNYNGEKYSILYAQNINASLDENEITYKLDEFQSGDIVSEAVYERTRLAEEKLNISIVSEHILYEEINTMLTNATASGSADFEALCGRLTNISSSSLGGNLYDVKKLDTLDLTNSWWDQKVNDAMTLGGKQYIFSGDMNYYDDYAITCMVFNKRLFTNYQLEEPYQTVREGKWTMDALSTLINDTANDINGDGVMDENDFYGFVANSGLLSYMLVGSGEQFTTIDANGNRVLNMTESILNKAQSIADRYLNNESVVIEERKLGYEKGDRLFPEGHSLLASTLVGTIVDYRELCEDDFGIIPFPKFDESQDGYQSVVQQHWASAVAIPMVCNDTVKVGYVLETLGYYSPDTVTNAVIENNIQTRSARDQESGEMLRMIFSSKIFETSVVYDWGIYSKWCDLTMQETPNIVSEFKSVEKSINKKIEKTMTSIASNP